MSIRTGNRRGATLTRSAKKHAAKRNLQRGLSTERNLMSALRVALGRVFRATLIASLIALIGAGVYYAIPLFDRPIERVVIEGDFKQIEPDQLHVLVAQQITTTLLRTDIQGMRVILEQQPWISEVQISRQWPDQLSIRVMEEKPIARWGASGFVNQRGEVIDAPIKVEILGLPQLIGSKDQAEKVTAQFLLLSRALISIGLEIRQLEQSATGDWKIVLDNDIELLLGRGDLLGKTRRIIAVWNSALSKKAAQIARLDARYSNGVAVSWNADPLLEQNFSIEPQRNIELQSTAQFGGI